MANGMTNRARKNMYDIVYRDAAPPANFYVALCTVTDTPTAGTNIFGELTEIAIGNGYDSGGYQLNRNATDFDLLQEDDANNRADLYIKDLAYTAMGGPLPASGDGAIWAVLTDDNATVANREVWGWWDLGSARTVSDGQDLILENLILRGGLLAT